MGDLGRERSLVPSSAILKKAPMSPSLWGKPMQFGFVWWVVAWQSVSHLKSGSILRKKATCHLQMAGWRSFFSRINFLINVKKPIPYLEWNSARNRVTETKSLPYSRNLCRSQSFVQILAFVQVLRLYLGFQGRHSIPAGSAAGSLCELYYGFN